MMMPGLMLDLRPGEIVSIGDDGGIQVQLVHKSGQLARLRVVAPTKYRIEKSGTKELPTPAMRGKVEA